MPLVQNDWLPSRAGIPAIERIFEYREKASRGRIHAIEIQEALLILAEMADRVSDYIGSLES